MTHRPPPTTPDLSDEALRELFDAWEDAEVQRATNQKMGVHGADAPPSMDYYLDYYNFVVRGDPSVGLTLVLKLCGAAPNDAALCFVGVNFVEPLLDLHWKKIGERFYEAAARKRSVREALSCAWLNLKPMRRGGDELERRLRNLVQGHEADRKG